MTRTRESLRTDERDPRVDPKRGDMLEIGGIGRRTVVLVRPTALQWSHLGIKYECSIQSWRDWAKNAKVLHAAD